MAGVCDHKSNTLFTGCSTRDVHSYKVLTVEHPVNRVLHSWSLVFAWCSICGVYSYMVFTVEHPVHRVFHSWSHTPAICRILQKYYERRNPFWCFRTTFRGKGGQFSTWVFPLIFGIHTKGPHIPRQISFASNGVSRQNRFVNMGCRKFPVNSRKLFV